MNVSTRQDLRGLECSKGKTVDQSPSTELGAWLGRSLLRFVRAIRCRGHADPSFDAVRMYDVLGIVGGIGRLSITLQVRFLRDALVTGIGIGLDFCEYAR
jgi:hypothetical protein